MQSDKRSKRLNKLLTLTIFVMTGSILGYLIYKQRDEILGHTWQFHLWPTVISFIIFSFSIIWVAFLWATIMNSLGGKLPLGKHLRYYCIANLAKRIPGTVWYIASRAQAYNDDGITMRLTFVATGTETILIFIAGIIVLLMFGIPIILTYQFSIWIFAIAIVIGLPLIHPKILSKMFRLFKIDVPNLKYRSIIFWLIGYAAVWIMGGSILFTVANVIFPLSIAHLGYAIGSWTLMGTITYLLLFSPVNLGLTEIGISLLLSAIMPASYALVTAILMRVFLTIYEFVWAAIFLGVDIAFQKRYPKRVKGN